MRPIVIRGLKRQLVFDAAWRDTPLGPLETRPVFGWDEPEPEPEPVAVETCGRHFRIRLPSGEGVQGSLRDLAVALDLSLQRDEIGKAATIMLPGAVLRDRHRRRVACLGVDEAERSLLMLALISEGWSYESDGYVLVRPDGLVCLPRTLRVWHVPSGLPGWLRARIEAAGQIEINPQVPQRVLDPSLLGPPGARQDWRLDRTRPSAVLLLESNPGGRNGVRLVAPDAGFAQVLTLCHGPMSARAAADLRRHLADVPVARLRLGTFDGLAALVGTLVEELSCTAGEPAPDFASRDI